MPTRLSESVRRQILADIGIDVWRLRTGRPAEPAVTAPDAQAKTTGPSPVRARPAAPAAAERPAAGSLPVQSPSEPPAASPVASRARRPGAEPTPFAVVSLSVPGVTLLLEGRPGPRAARVARDLFGATGARWDAEPACREFDWPPAPGLAVVTGPDAARRALGAFVEKELADHRSRLLLLAESLAARLDTTPAGIRRVLLPDLERLAVDAQAKRKVWSALAQWLRDGAAADGLDGR